MLSRVEHSARSPSPALDVRRLSGAAAGLIALCAIWFAPIDAPAPARHALAISIATMLWWATNVVDPAWAGMGALGLFAVSSTASWQTLASGFWNSTTGFLAGALAIGAFVASSGLARRMAYSFAARLGASYSGLLLALICADFALTFVIPSGIARVTVLAAMVAGLVGALGLEPRSLEARGLMIGVTCTASIFDKMILSGTSSILASGLIKQFSGHPVSYGLWFLAYFPCDALAILGCWRLVLWLFPARSGGVTGGREYFRGRLAALGPIHGRERRAAVLVTAAVALWMTDGVHGLSPTTVALAIGAIALLPGIRVLEFRDLRQLPYRTIIFTATALSMSGVLAATGALPLLTHDMMGWMRPLLTNRWSTTLVLFWGAFAFHLLLGAQNLMLTATMPAVLSLGVSAGYSPVVVGLVWVFGTAGHLFAYQSGVLMVGYSYGYFDVADLIKLGMLLAILESILLLLIVPLYWPLIGLS